MGPSLSARGLSLVGSPSITTPAPRVEAFACTHDDCEQVLVSSLRAEESVYEHLWDALCAGWSMRVPELPGDRWTGRCSEHGEGR